MKTVVLFGDSLLGRFGKDLIQKMENTVKGITVYNCAAGGLNTEDGVKRAGFISGLNPDYVLLSFGANDAAPWKKQVPLDNFESNLNLIINFFKDSKIILFPCPPANSPNEPEKTKAFNEEVSKYNQIIKKIAENKKLRFIDSFKIYEDFLRRGKDYHEEDGLHLNDLGYEILIKELKKIMK